MAQIESESSDKSVALLQSQVAALERQVFSLLLVLVLISGTVTIYFYREASLRRKDIENLTPQAAQIARAYDESKPAVTGFLQQLGAYGQTHPDFQKQILDRFFPPQSTGGTAASGK